MLSDYRFANWPFLISDYLMKFLFNVLFYSVQQKKVDNKQSDN